MQHSSISSSIATAALVNSRVGSQFWLAVIFADDIFVFMQNLLYKSCKFGILLLPNLRSKIISHFTMDLLRFDGFLLPVSACARKPTTGNSSNLSEQCLLT